MFQIWRKIVSMSVSFTLRELNSIADAIAGLEGGYELFLDAPFPAGVHGRRVSDLPKSIKGKIKLEKLGMPYLRKKSS